ncbi:MAG: hypothetical protein ACK4FB_10390 [Brevundimonas sp.]|uniref:hypothetical protein n=1 Tax=Brevundimonas sp. TaxID=1871086 RepID=UPI00391D731E
MPVTQALDDHAYRTLAAMAAAELGYYVLLSPHSSRRAKNSGWATPHGVLSAFGQALFLAEQGRRHS